MEFDPIKLAQSKTRSQWIEHWKSLFVQCRTSIACGGEKSIICSFVAGILLVLLFKVILLVGFLLGLVAVGVYFMAPEDTEVTPPKDHSNT